MSPTAGEKAEAPSAKTKAQDTPDPGPTNKQLMLEVLGPDWRPGGPDSQGQVEIAPRTPSARAARGLCGDRPLHGVPSLRRELRPGGPVPSPGRDGDPGCRLRGEDIAGRPHGLAAAAALRLQPGPRRGQLESTLAYFERTYGTFARVEFATFDTTGRPTSARQDVALAWMDRRQDRVTALVADARAEPRAAAGEHVDPFMPPSDAELRRDAELVVFREALGPAFYLNDRRVYLDHRTAKARELPSADWGVDADIATITQAQFEAACAPKAGSAGCTERSLPDGRTVWTLTWADRDATSGEMRGETAVCFAQADGNVVLASLTLTRAPSAAADADRDKARVLDWFGWFQDALATAATKGTTGTS